MHHVIIFATLYLLGTPIIKSKGKIYMNPGDRDFIVKDRRIKPRIICDYPAIVKGYSRNGIRFEESARVVNMSASGIYVILNYPIENDTEISIRIALPTQGLSTPNTSRLSATGIVVRTENHSLKEYGIGVQFRHYRFL